MIPVDNPETLGAAGTERKVFTFVDRNGRVVWRTDRQAGRTRGHRRNMARQDDRSLGQAH